MIKHKLRQKQNKQKPLTIPGFSLYFFTLAIINKSCTSPVIYKFPEYYNPIQINATIVEQITTNQKFKKERFLVLSCIPIRLKCDRISKLKKKKKRMDKFSFIKQSIRGTYQSF